MSKPEMVCLYSVLVPYLYKERLNSKVCKLQSNQGCIKTGFTFDN